MGKDIHVRLVHKEYETNLWKQVILYYKKNEEIKPVDVYPFRNYELFNILSEEDDFYHTIPIITNDLPSSLKQEIEEYQKEGGGYKFQEITLADLELYLYRMPKVRDWDYEEDDPKAFKDNPVKFFIERIIQYLDFAEPYWDLINLHSNVRILYWFDN